MAEVNLHPSVDTLLRRICDVKKQSWPDALALRALASLSEDEALVKLRSIFNTPEIRNLSALIMLKVRDCSSPSPSKAARTSYAQFPSSASSICPPSPQPLHSHFAGSAFIDRSHQPESNNGQSRASASSIAPANLDQRLQAEAVTRFPNPDKDGDHEAQLVALGKLEFPKQFLILSYAGKRRLRECKSVTPNVITEWEKLPMARFEFAVWDALGSNSFISKEDRHRVIEFANRADWDCGHPLDYHCHVSEDGSYIFKGPYLNKMERTLLHKQLGDDNVLMVNFAGNATHSVYNNNYHTYMKIAREGILVGLRRYYFFVFKDGSGREETSCYFVRVASDAAIDKDGGYKLANRTIREARSLFMHGLTMPSVEKYMIRFSLILSKTTSVKLDWSLVNVKSIDDVNCLDESGNPTFGKDRKPLIHTDGTGFISEDLALLCPEIQVKEHFMSDEERLLDPDEQENNNEIEKLEFRTEEPALLTQFRLFHEGTASKGTFLVNKRLPLRTMCIRPSMLKVEKDSEMSDNQTINSLEIVATSSPPKKAYLSRSIIALLLHGGVPKEFFMELISKALEDALGVYRKTRTALQVTVKNSKYDDGLLGATMIRLGIPLDESYLRYHLSIIMKKLERKDLMKGKIFIPETYMLMGTADPTMTLERDEVCIILKDGQISGKVLVYRHPGLHFADIHILKATYVEELESYVGNAKYAIFFSCKGPRNIADEMGGGDFDGDMYWVSRNPKLLKWYKPPCEPWMEGAIPTKNVASEKPADLSDQALEDRLFGNFLKHRFQPSFATGVAANNWLASMDKLLTLGDSSEKDDLKQKISTLVDIYYTALDAGKKGVEVEVPQALKVDKFPSYMKKQNLQFEDKKDYYTSNSILGLIYDKVNTYQPPEHYLKGVEKFPSFDVNEVPQHSFQKWEKLYAAYRRDVTAALSNNVEKDSINAAIDVIEKKYKQHLYNADDFEESKRPEEEILDEAHAIYHLCYDYAKKVKKVASCGFAWKVAGKALCELHAKKKVAEKALSEVARKKNERWLKIAPSVLEELCN